MHTGNLLFSTSSSHTTLSLPDCLILSFKHSLEGDNTRRYLLFFGLQPFTRQDDPARGTEANWRGLWSLPAQVVDIRRISATGNLLRHHIWMRLSRRPVPMHRSLIDLSLSVFACARNLLPFSFLWPFVSATTTYGNQVVADRLLTSTSIVFYQTAWMNLRRRGVFVTRSVIHLCDKKNLF